MRHALASTVRPITIVAGIICVAGVAAWLWHRNGQGQLRAASATDAASELADDLDDSPPDSFTFEPEPESLRALTARPSDRIAGYQTPDDYGSLAPEELGVAFLAGATDTARDEPPSSIAELSGFQIFDGDAPELQPDEQLDDEELARIFARPS